MKRDWVFGILNLIKMKKLSFEKFTASKISNSSRILGGFDATAGGTKTYDTTECGTVSSIVYTSDTACDGITTYHGSTIYYNCGIQ